MKRNIYKFSLFIYFLFYGFMISSFAQKAIDIPMQFFEPEFAWDNETKLNGEIISKTGVNANYPWTVFNYKGQKFLVEAYDARSGQITVASDPNYSITAGWSTSKGVSVKMDIKDVIPNTRCILVERSKIPIKVMLLNTAAIIRKSGTTNENYKFYSDPGLKNPNGNEARIFDFFYVYKIVGDAVLVGRQERFSAGQDFSEVFLGWISRKRLVVWDTRVALQPSNNDEARVRANIKPTVFIDSNSVLQYTQKAGVNTNKVLWENNNEGIKLGTWRRFPIIKSFNNDIYKIGLAGAITVIGREGVSKTAEWKASVDTAAQRLMNSKRNVNIVFVIDATRSMAPYFPAVAGAIDNAMKDISAGTKNTLRFAAIAFKDQYAVTSNKSQLVQIFKLGAAQNLSSWLKRVNTLVPDDAGDDAPEALFYGLNSVRQVGLTPGSAGETNLLILIGDVGNHNRNDASQVSLQKVVDQLSEFKFNFIALQVINKNTQDYANFVNQTKSLVSGEIKKMNLQTSLVSENNAWVAKGSAHQFKIIPASPNSSKSAIDVQKEVEKQLKQLNTEIATILFGLHRLLNEGASIGEITLKDSSDMYGPAIREFMKELQTELKMTDNEFDILFQKKVQLYQEGYTSLMAAGNEVFEPVLLLSNGELSSQINLLNNLANAASGSSKRIEIVKVWKRTLRDVVGLSDAEIEKLSLEDVNRMLYGIPIKTNILGGKKVSDFLDPAKISDLQINTYANQIDQKYAALYSIFNAPDNASIVVDKMFYSQENKFFWIPFTYLP